MKVAQNAPKHAYPRMPFGQYEGTPFDELPIEYISHLLFGKVKQMMSHRYMEELHRAWEERKPKRRWNDSNLKAPGAIRTDPINPKPPAGQEEMHSAYEAFFIKLKAGICPRCDKPFEGKTLVGRCYYAFPCNCRLYESGGSKEEGIE